MISNLNMSYLTIVNYLLLAIGLYLTLKKCGVKGYYGLIPFARWYWFGKAICQEALGRTLMVTGAISGALSLVFPYITSLSDEQISAWHILIVVIYMAVTMYQIVLNIRIGGRFCDWMIQGKRRWYWIVLWIFAEWLVMVIFAKSDKYQPKYMYGDISAPRLSNAEQILPENEAGLTVKLKERAVTESFGKKILLRDINLQIDPGCMVLLLGSSGCGKTTFINAVTGYEKGTAEITLQGNDVYKEYAHMKHNIGVVPQKNLVRSSDQVKRTIKEAAYLRLPKSVSAEERAQRVEKVLATFGLTGVANSTVSKLSGGQLRRLNIAMEFIADPELFILDEPDSGLDGIMARSLMENLRAIADEGKIVIVITHTPDRVIDLFDEVIVMAKDAENTGRLAFYGEIDDAREFFDVETMEQILLRINRKGDGGQGLGDEYIEKFIRVQEKLTLHGREGEAVGDENEDIVGELVEEPVVEVEESGEEQERDSRERTEKSIKASPKRIQKKQQKKVAKQTRKKRRKTGRRTR